MTEQTQIETEAESLLRTKREEQGITLDMVHEATKIPMDVLRALEEGYKVRTLSSFYYKGFLKIYAQFLDLDPQDVLKEFTFFDLDKPQKKSSVIQSPKKATSDILREAEEKRLAEQKKIEAEKRQRLKAMQKNKATEKFEKIQQKMPVLLDASKKILTKQRQKRLIKISVVIIAIFISFKLIGMIMANIFSGEQEVVSEVGQAVMVESSQVEIDTSQPIEKPVAEQPKKQDQPKVAVPAPMPPKKPNENFVEAASQSDVSVTVRAVNNNWLRVQVDGSVVFQAVIKEGVAETWTGNKGIEISARNINDLEFEVNGKVIGTLGRGHTKAKKVSITKDGLTVKK